MVITAIPRRAGRADPPSEVEPAGTDETGRKQRPLRRHGWAASTQDRFLDLIVLLSVLEFLALAVGVGTLVLQATWPR